MGPYTDMARINWDEAAESRPVQGLPHVGPQGRIPPYWSDLQSSLRWHRYALGRPIGTASELV